MSYFVQSLLEKLERNVRDELAHALHEDSLSMALKTEGVQDLAYATNETVGLPGLSMIPVSVCGMSLSEKSRTPISAIPSQMNPCSPSAQNRSRQQWCDARDRDKRTPGARSDAPSSRNASAARVHRNRRLATGFEFRASASPNCKQEQAQLPFSHWRASSSLSACWRPIRGLHGPAELH